MVIADRPLVHIPAQLLDISDVALPTEVQKRDGREVPFEPGRISRAIDRCFKGIDRTPLTSVDDLTARVLNTISTRGGTWSVEGIQDIVEMTLAGAGEFEAAKSYILYRAEHARLRDERPIPDEIRELFNQSDQYFPTQLQKFQFFDKYSRWRDDLGRRETWPETVERSVDFLLELVNQNVNALAADDIVFDGTIDKIRKAILEMRAMPSMRLLAMAGPAARRQNASMYNCCFVPVDAIDAFVETLLLSMSGCGVGYSVERRHVDKLPMVESQREGMPVSKFIVDDSTEGWGEAVRTGLTLWFQGYDVEFNYGLLRLAGAPLKTKGGRASGPDPLRNALAFARERILARQGSRLRPLDAHDIMCQIGNAAVSGGVRRTALISLFDIDDMEMANCKVGDFETHNSQRWNANNSAVIPENGISQSQFLKIWQAMIDSERGEPGFVSRQAVKNTIPSRREYDPDFGFNPCVEIILKPMQMCNLSICVARHDDTYETLAEKVEIAAIIGTIQSLATYFPGLRPQWSENGKKERLLGVDITGQRDCPLLEDPDVLRGLRAIAIETNLKWAERFGINQSAAVTTVKPSGNSSVLLDCASGIHPRWAPYYERNVRVSATSPIYKVLRDAGVNLAPENGQESMAEPYTYVASFVVKAPEGTPTREDLSALDQADYWLHVKDNWTEHNPSVTCQYRPDEIIELLAWVWEHRDKLGGMSFLPYSDVKLSKLPYIQISKEEYEKRAASFPNIDFSRIMRYEQDDQSTAAQELACVGGLCET